MDDANNRRKQHAPEAPNLTNNGRSQSSGTIATPNRLSGFHNLLTPFLSAQDRGRLMQVDRTAHHQVGNAPFPGSDVSMHDISRQLSGFRQVGLHGTSTADAPSLYSGVKPPPRESRTFAKQGELGGQLGPGFYITNGFGPGEKARAKDYAEDRVKHVLPQNPTAAPVIMRAHVKGLGSLASVEADGGKSGNWWPRAGEKPDYLEPHSVKTGQFTDNRSGQVRTFTKITGADVVTAPMGGVTALGRKPMIEHVDGHVAHQVKLNWHALDDTAQRPGAQVLMTPHQTSTALPPAFLEAVSARKKQLK